MGNIKDEAKNYQSKASVKNISELPSVDVDLAILNEEEAEFPYKYIEVNNERYKIGASVLAQLKVLLEDNPNLKKFKVKMSGKGMDTRYLVIPLV
jgi:hypothetical protein